MATIGKKKLKEIKLTSVIHDAIIESMGQIESKFLENNPEMWQTEEKEIYDILITHETLLKNKIIAILERKK